MHEYDNHGTHMASIQRYCFIDEWRTFSVNANAVIAIKFFIGSENRPVSTRRMYYNGLEKFRVIAYGCTRSVLQKCLFISLRELAALRP